MLNIPIFLCCVLSIVHAGSDYSELYYCSNGLDEEPLLRSVQPQFCVPAYSVDRPSEEVNAARVERRKRSVEEIEPWSPMFRMSRGRETIKTIHLPSSFTPRLGRRRSGGRVIGDPTQHVINLNAGTAFTPRLGRRIQES